MDWHWTGNKPLQTHWGRETPICVTKQGHHWFRYWLVAWSAPSHYLNQCWIIVNWTLSNIFQWNLNQNTTIFIEENAFENVIWKWRPFCLGFSVLEKYWGMVVQMGTIGWGSGLSCVRCQSISSTNDDLLSIRHIEKNLVRFVSNYDKFHWRKSIW